MKRHFFHLMPYPDLPDDFKQRYHSVRVDAPAVELFDPRVGERDACERPSELVAAIAETA